MILLQHPNKITLIHPEEKHVTLGLTYGGTLIIYNKINSKYLNLLILSRDYNDV